AVLVVGTPERGFTDPAGFTQQAGREPERVEHFYAAAGDAVCLAELKRTVAPFDDTCSKAGRGGELGGQNQACGAAAHDQHVDSVGQALGGMLEACSGVLGFGVAKLVAV